VTAKMADEDEKQRQDVILKFARDRWLAHRTLFAHRHPNLSPDFHRDIVAAWHSDAPFFQFLAFRGAGKSTLSEEGITIEACLRTFHNGIILGETYERACERLRSIKHEFENNPYIEDLFGSQVGQTWTEGKIVLTNGIILQAYGRGQSLRGAKHLDQRPDRAFADDIEDEESVFTPEARDKVKRWWMSTVMPAMAPGFKLRMAATPLHPQALAMEILKDPTWRSLRIPVYRLDPVTGEEIAAWPDRFPLDWVHKEKERYQRLGAADQFQQEYMCEAEDPAMKPFTAGLFKSEAIVRTWQAVYAMVDPARTVKATSASTGVAVWSWINNRLIVWDGYAKLWRPDEIIADMFRIADQFNPVAIGVEEDGLAEFILQPLRQEQIRRGLAIPVRALKAPRGKLDFIRSLQPFFKAGEVIFAGECADLKAQLLSFPSGRIDAPNALAYALKLRPGSVIYEDFSVQNIAEDMAAEAGLRPVLAVNAAQEATTGVLLGFSGGSLRVYADWAREGDPGLVLGDIVREAAVEAGPRVRVFAPLQHFSGHDTIGLRPAAAKIPIEIHRGGPAHQGREEIRALLRRQVKGFPALRVSSRARWTLNAFSGGYCRQVNKSGALADSPQEGVYKTLMESIESFAALMRISERDEEDGQVNYGVTSSGRRFISARGR
jgi:hypothetical protein